MAIRWRPNTTCECEVEYTINNSLPPDTAHGGLRCDSFAFTRKCPAHSSFADKQLWDIIWDENPRYSTTYDLITAHGPPGLYDTDTETGSKALKHNVGLNLTWSGTAPNRVLTIAITGANVTTAQKNTIRAAINAKIPGGKVVLA